jgi:hypothetical protein
MRLSHDLDSTRTCSSENEVVSFKKSPLKAAFFKAAPKSPKGDLKDKELRMF